MRKRTDKEIRTEILAAASAGATKTEIMFRAFLTHNQFYSYLASLMASDLIRYQKVQGLYRTSEIGLEYLGTQASYPANKSSSSKVLVIGLGQLGLPVAKYIKDRGGFDTYGYDISTKAMDRAQKIAGIKRIGDNNNNNNKDKDKENGENNNYIVIDEEEQLQQQHNTVNPHKKSLDIRMHAVPQIEIAEITKIAENAHRYLQIAFAEDLYLYCQANNINFAELRDALNTKWNVNILEPRDGIGGHCLPKDTKMFLQSSKSIRSKILASAIEVDEDYRRYRQQKNMVLQPNQALSSRKGYDDNNIGET